MYQKYKIICNTLFVEKSQKNHGPTMLLVTQGRLQTKPRYNNARMAKAIGIFF